MELFYIVLDFIGQQGIHTINWRLIKCRILKLFSIQDLVGFLIIFLNKQ